MDGVAWSYGCEFNNNQGWLLTNKIRMTKPYVEIFDFQTQKRYRIEIFPEMISSDSADIKKYYLTNLITGVQNHSEIPTELRDKLVQKISQNSIDLFNEASKSVEGRSRVLDILLNTFEGVKKWVFNEDLNGKTYSEFKTQFLKNAGNEILDQVQDFVTDLF